MTLDISFLLRFILATLAVYRVAMFTREDGPFYLFSSFRELLGKRAAKDKFKGRRWGITWMLAELTNCPHCAGVWLSFLVLPSVIWPSAVTDGILICIAIAGLQSFLTGRGE